MPRPSPPRQRLVTAVLIVALLATLPGTALAAPVQGVQETVVVESGETVDSIQVVANTVIVRGTVDGDVRVATGSLLVTGTVAGDVEAAAGSVVIDGQVDGDVDVGAGSLTLGEDGRIGGTLRAGAGSVQLGGTVEDDVAIGAGSIVLEPSATVRGDLRYDGELEDRGATVEGSTERDESLAASPFGPTDSVLPALVGLFGFIVTLLVGAVLLLAFPAGSRRIVDRVVDEPVATGLYGLAALVGIPIVLVLVTITIIGIPLAVVGALLFLLLVWVAAVYGRYAIGEWLLGYVGIENRWVALLLGVVLVALAARIPVLGGVVRFLVLLLGLGALVTVGLGGYRRRREPAG